MRLLETHNTLLLSVFFFFFFFFFSFFCQPYPGLRNRKSVILILKISQYGGSWRWVQLFPRCPCKNRYKNWYLHFYETLVLMATKLGKLVTCHEELPSIMLLHPLVMWSYEITRQTKTVISPLPQYMWPQN